MWEWTPPSETYRIEIQSDWARADVGHRDTYETEEVKTAVGLLRVLAGGDDDLVLVESPLLDRDIDPDNVLPDNATGTDVKMTGGKSQNTIRA